MDSEDFLNKYEVIIKLKARGMNEEEALNEYLDVLFFIQKNVLLKNYSINVKRVK